MALVHEATENVHCTLFCSSKSDQWGQTSTTWYGLMPKILKTSRSHFRLHVKSGAICAVFGPHNSLLLLIRESCSHCDLLPKKAQLPLACFSSLRGRHVDDSKQNSGSKWLHPAYFKVSMQSFYFPLSTQTIVLVRSVRSTSAQGFASFSRSLGESFLRDGTPFSRRLRA